MSATGPGTKRRRVRKGTRSCWECRKRKVKCLFAQPEDATCLNCVERETQCISQKFVDVAEPDGFLDSHSRVGVNSIRASVETEDVTQRLDRLEKLLIAGNQYRRSVNSEDASSSQSPPLSRPFAHPPAPTADLFDSSAAKHAHVVTTIAQGDMSYSPPEGPMRENSPEAGINNPYIMAQREALRDRHRRIAQDLYDLLPSPKLRRVLANESPGASVVLSFAHSVEDQLQGKVEPTWSLASATWPTPETDPVLIARRLMQYIICMQAMRSDFDASGLDLGTAHQACEVLGVWIGAITTLAANDDELMGCSEGLEVLALLGVFHSDAGHPRRAWAVNRRALNICQLLGVHRLPSAPIRSRASPGDPECVPSLSVLWYRINVLDRYHSLVLGLPIGSQKDMFLRADPHTRDRALDDLEKQHAVACRLIADRDDSSGPTEAYETTKQIHAQLEAAASKLSVSWWAIPTLTGATPQLNASRKSFHLQVSHYMLLIFLHLPYLLRNNSTQRASRQTCIETSRAILKRFIALRQDNVFTVRGRMTDYAALVAGMTLLLSYLGQADGTRYEETVADRSLIEDTLLMFREIAAVKRDRLATEGAETITQLLPIISGGQSPLVGSQPFRFVIPSLGTINISAPAPSPDAGAMSSGSEPVSDGYIDMQAWLSFNPTLPGSMPEYPGSQDWSLSGSDTQDQDQTLLQKMEEEGLRGMNAAYWTTLSQSFWDIDGSQLEYYPPLANSL